jgi:alanine dehydrogenase
MPDAEFAATGAKIVASADDIWAASDLVLKVKEPMAEEYPLNLGARQGQVLFTYLHLAASLPCTEALLAAGNTAIAYETVRLPDGSLPLLTPMSEVAGRMAPLMGAHHLMSPAGGRGVLVCGVPGVRSAKVVILGAGVAGMAAATLAVGMHSEVYILDRNLERLRQVDHHFRGALETVASSTHAIEETCIDADIVIGAVLVVGAKAPKLVSDDLVAQMRDGSVLVDISVDQGGCFESTHPTTHSDPTFEVNGSLFYCVANMPGAVPHTSTHALVNATLPYVPRDRQARLARLVRGDEALAEGVNVVEGSVVYEPVAAAHGLELAEFPLACRPRLIGGCTGARIRIGVPSSPSGRGTTRGRPTRGPGDRARGCHPAGPDRPPGPAAPCAGGSRRPTRRAPASGPSPSSGGPRRILTEHSSRGIRNTVVAASSLSEGDRAYSHWPGATWLLMARSPASFSSDRSSTSGRP